MRRVGVLGLVSLFVATLVCAQASPPEIGGDDPQLAPEANLAREPGTYVCKLDGSAEQRLAGPTAPAWLPGGRYLLLVARNGLYRVANDGSEKQLLWSDKRTRLLFNLQASASGHYASAMSVRDDGAGLVKVWRVSDGALLLDDLLYPNAVAIPAEDGSPYGRNLNAVMAWNRNQDLLAWVPIDYEGLSERRAAVKVFNAPEGRWSTWYLNRPAWTLTWHTERSSLMAIVGRQPTDEEPQPAVSLVEIDAADQRRTTVAERVRDAIPSEEPMRWLPTCGLFVWGQSLFGADGQPAPPFIPEEEAATAKLLWVSTSGRDLLFAVSNVQDDGSPRSDLKLGMTGADWSTYRTVTTLPVLPMQVQATADGSRLVFVVGGYTAD